MGLWHQGWGAPISVIPIINASTGVLPSNTSLIWLIRCYLNRSRGTSYRYVQPIIRLNTNIV